MMTKGLIDRLLGPEEISAAKEAFEPLSETRDPTLDERISLYLRAVHGKQDFGNAEYSDARNRVLNAMAADIGEKLGFILPEQTSTQPVGEVSQIGVDLSFADAEDMHAALAAPRAFEGPPPPASSLHSAEAMKTRVEAMMTRGALAPRASLDLPKSALRWSGDKAEARRLREDQTHHYIRFTFIAAIAVVIVCLIGMGFMFLH
jgi:hypothetical protein